MVASMTTPRLVLSIQPAVISTAEPKRSTSLLPPPPPPAAQRQRGRVRLPRIRRRQQRYADSEGDGEAGTWTGRDRTWSDDTHDRPSPLPIVIPTMNLESGCRQLCEVLGRSVCHRCSEKDYKQNQLNRSNLSQSQPTESLEFVSSDLSMILQLQKFYPHLTQAQIQQKINKGQILPAAIPIELKRRRDVCKSLDSDKPPHPEKKQLGNPHRFYSDMDDLRRKIQAGEIPRSKGASVTPTLMERLFPPFLSPRVSNMNRPGTTTIYYDPPLLPLDCQNPQSNFFAGENPKCKLPTPLPENPAYINAIQSGRASAHPTSGSQPGSSRLSRQNSMVLMRQPSRVSREPSFIINRETSYIKSRQPTMS